MNLKNSFSVVSPNALAWLDPAVTREGEAGRSPDRQELQGLAEAPGVTSSKGRDSSVSELGDVGGDEPQVTKPVPSVIRSASGRSRRGLVAAAAQWLLVLAFGATVAIVLVYDSWLYQGLDFLRHPLQY